MKAHIKRCLLTGIAVLLILALNVLLGSIMSRSIIDIRQKDAEHSLHFYGEKLMLQFRGSLNEAETLAKTAYTMKDTGREWFENAASVLMKREEVLYTCLIEGDTVVRALPEDVYKAQEGKVLKDFSYVYTLAKVVKDLVVEGPVTIEGTNDPQEVFLFLQPILEGDAYLGEVAVALDRDFVLEQLGLEYLADQGFDYELWRVEPQNGGKEVVAVTNKEIDFSNAVKTTFYLPTEWNLGIQPREGWLGSGYGTGVLLFCSVAAALMLWLAYSLYTMGTMRRAAVKTGLKDRQTGMYNRTGFTKELQRWLTRADSPVVLFYFVFEGYDQIAQLIGQKQEEAILKEIPQRLMNFIQSPFIAGRLGAGNLALAVREEMDETEQEDFARGMSLELLLKIRLNDEKVFLTAQYQYARCQQGKDRAEAELASLIQAYYKKQSEESPIQMLTKKCRQLIDGRTDVVFDEYTDVRMMELSKTFNQYRKKVEQLAYSDPVFKVGNRPKYLRDTNILISYDKKRRFSLFCLDICRFSQYNQLFSMDIGDEILHEVIHRLSRQFGTYLYRINGDVFLGISLSDEKEGAVAARLQSMLGSPVTAGNASFALDARIAVCRYPYNGNTSEILLDRIQSALRYAKEADQKLVFYNDTLDAIIRTETDILRRLETALFKETLEVWYQPMLFVENGRFEAVEALVRLPDGLGGYYSAGQVVALAERSGLVEQLGDYVLKRACGFMHDYDKELGLLHMSVNLSVQQLLIGNSGEHLRNIIGSSGGDHKKITLEITESVLIQSMKEASATLGRLREHGIRIALDDFGVGYSSLNYLSNLPVDVIKIDRALIQQICTSRKQYALLCSIVDIAKVNSLTVVSEGIETEEEQKLVSASGVQYIQGYYYARPMRETQLIEFLKTNKKP